MNENTEALALTLALACAFFSRATAKSNTPAVYRSLLRLHTLPTADEASELRPRLNRALCSLFAAYTLHVQIHINNTVWAMS